MKTKDQLITLGLTEAKADEVMYLESKMLERAMAFQFVKKDNSVRDARGTLVRDMMIQENGSKWEPLGESKPVPASIFRFWDIEAMAWRCFDVTRFVGICQN